MKLSSVEPGYAAYTQLDSRVLAVLVRHYDGWTVYVGAVAGERHDFEWHEVRDYGNTQTEAVGRAIAETLFHPGFEIDLPYAP